MTERTTARAVIHRSAKNGPFAYQFFVGEDVTSTEVSKTVEAAASEAIILGKALPGRLERVIITFVSTPPEAP